MINYKWQLNLLHVFQIIPIIKASVIWMIWPKCWHMGIDSYNKAATWLRTVLWHHTLTLEAHPDFRGIKMWGKGSTS